MRHSLPRKKIFGHGVLSVGIWLILTICMANAEEMALEGTWLFKLGDDSTWSNPEMNDSAWFPIRVPGFWEDQNYENYDGFAWYRYHFQANSTFNKKDSLILFLGKIDAADEAFLNGVRIGGSGLFPPESVSAKNSVRRYSFPTKLLKSDNVLALRVFDDRDKGGLYSGPLKLVASENHITTSPTVKVLQNSINLLPFTNGISACCYNLKTRSFSNFYPHIYRKFDEKTDTPVLISQAKTVIYRNQQELSLTNLKTAEIGYIEGTGIVKHTLIGDDFTLTQYGFCPFTLQKPFWIFIVVLQGNNLDSLTMNFSIKSNNIDLDIGKWAYQQGDRKWLTVLINFNSSTGDADRLFLKKFKNEHPGFKALTDEIDWWQDWHAQTLLPENIQPSERSVYLQSLAVLKMAQCREAFPAGGQIIASLPPSFSNYCWPRDQAYAVEALLSSGHIDEARQALQFIMNGRCGRYKIYQWNGRNLGIGVDYAVSIFRYLGNGVEESVLDDNGLTQHLDGFGLTLWNLNRYLEITGDTKFLKYYWTKISRNIADVLPELIDASGLVRAESGPWEKTALFKHYTYTSACTYRGLIDAAMLARLMNDEARARRYEETAIGIRINMEKNLIDHQVNSLKGNLEDLDPNLYVDASVVEALNWIFNPQDQVNKGTLDALKKYLVLKNSGRGYCRTTNDLITRHYEWVFGDLRMITAIKKMTDFKTAADLQNWITKQATDNFGLIPQYFDIRNADYIGIVPRCGLGAGAYIANFWRQ